MPGRVVLASLIAGCGFAPNAPVDAPIGTGSDASDAPVGPDIAVTFGERPTADHKGVTTDSYIDSAAVTITHGTEMIVRADAAPDVNVVLRFDLTALPVTTVVTSAEVELTTTTDQLESGLLEAYAVTESWDPASVTWAQRFMLTPWTNAGASAPGSRGALRLGKVFPNVDHTSYPFAIDAATVQGWIANPGSNDGIVLISTSTTGAGVAFSSSREPNVALRPLLRLMIRP